MQKEAQTILEGFSPYHNAMLRITATKDEMYPRTVPAAGQESGQAFDILEQINGKALQLSQASPGLFTYDQSLTATYKYYGIVIVPVMQRATFILEGLEATLNSDASLYDIADEIDKQTMDFPVIVNSMTKQHEPEFAVQCREIGLSDAQIATAAAALRRVSFDPSQP